MDIARGYFSGKWTAGALLFLGLFWNSGAARGEDASLAAVDHNDVIYLSPALKGWQGLPLGNGTLGAQAWTPDDMVFQLNTPWSGVLNFSIGRIHLMTSPGLISHVVSYKQRLVLSTATLVTDIETRTGPVHIKSWIAAGKDMLVIEVKDGRSGPVETTVEIENWHPTAKLEAQPDALLLTDKAATPEAAVRPSDAYAFALAVGVNKGIPVRTEVTGETSQLHLTAKTYTLLVSFNGVRETPVDVGANAQAALEQYRQDGLEKLRAEHEAWWAKFWAQSYIQLSPGSVPDYVANIWYIHNYAMASGSRGDVPPKFNGGLWLFDKDPREWGANYWHWNTQETYWPLYAANHLDLLKPYDEMYSNMLPRVEKQTQDYWGVDGASFGETIGWEGDDCTGKGPSQKGLHPRLPTPIVSSCTSLILSSSGEIAMQFWWKYLYTGDVAFLKDKAYPLMKAVCNFYAVYLEKDANGHYNMYPSNAHETFWKVKNPATDMSALRYCFANAITASKILGVDADQRAVWQDRLDHLPPWYIDPKTGGIGQFEPIPNQKIDVTNAENPNIFPMGVFPLIRADTPDAALGLKTFQTRLNKDVYGWTTDGEAAARLGLRDYMETFLPENLEQFQDHPSGLMDYYDRTPAIHPYLEGSGTFSTSVGEMLLQSWPMTAGDTQPIIRVCPALPLDWDARFKLLAMGGFEVECVAEKGMPRVVGITSTHGGTAQVANPFGKETVVTDGNNTVLKSADAILSFPTEAGHVYKLAASGDTPPALGPLPLAANDAPKEIKPGDRRWIGLPKKEEWKPPVEANAPQPPAPVGMIDRPAHPEIAPVRFSTPPTIDGDLSDECWKSAPSMGPFFKMGTKTGAVEQTDVRVGYDKDNLYLGITCWESGMEDTIAKYEATPGNRDESIFTDDSVEIFLKPDANSCWQLAVNILGAIYDSRTAGQGKEQVLYNPDWKVVTRRMGNRWIAEVAIPFHSIAALAPSKDAPWGINVGRNEYPHTETSTWAPLTGPAFAAPDQFGKMVFSEDIEPKPVPVTEPGLVARWSGESLAGQWARDLTGHGHDGFAVLPMATAPGRSDLALHFPGPGYLLVDNADELNLGGDFTIALWVNPAGMGSVRLLDKGTPGNDGYLLDTNPNNNLRLITKLVTFNRPETLPQGQWSHIAVTYGDKSLKIYLNGKLLEKNDAAGPLNSTTMPLHIGSDSDGTERFYGLMDKVSIWNRALTPEEVTALSQEK